MPCTTSWIRRAALLLLATSLVAGCGLSRTAKGAGIGAGAGGALGGFIGERTGNTAAGVVLGAAIGGAAGASIGRYMDKQAEELNRDLENARVERVGEGIKITFDSGILFDVNSASLREAARTNIEELSRVLNKYEDTEIVVQGHTDATGSEDYNQSLSERRAAAVADYTKSLGVRDGRITAVGLGESMPVADNDTEEGRQQNRRVEIAIFADETLKKAAESGDIEVEG